MKLLLLILLTAGLAVGCKQETFHERVEKDLSDRVINTNQPELGTDPNVRQDTKQGPSEVTSGTSTQRSAETSGGGSATGAGGAGPGYDGSKTNQPK